MHDPNISSAQISAAEFKRLSKKQLDLRLDALLSVPANELDMDEAQFLLHELQVHQIEQEIQNHELREVQERLELARDRYSDLYDFAPVGYVTLDRKGIIRSINLTAASMFGVERANLEGMPFITKLSVGEHPAFYKHLRGVFDSGKKCVHDFRLKQPNGQFMIVRLESIAVRNGDVDIKHCNCVIIDITDQKVTEEEVRAERDRAQLYLDTVENLIVVLDSNGDVSLANRKACEVLGYTEQELIGQNWFAACIPAAESETVSAAFSNLINGKSSQVDYFTNPVVTRTGQERQIAWHNKCLYGVDGNIVGTLGCGEDVTDRAHLEQELHLLYKAVEQSPDSVIVADLNGCIEYINPAFSHKTGYKAEEVIGKTPRILKSGKTPVDHYKKMWELLAKGEDWTGEVLNKKKNGELFWEQVYVSPIRDSKKNITHYLSIQVDVSEKKRLKQQAQQHQAELAFMARLNTMGEMATGLAHELNQPLSAINTYADVAIRMLDSGISQPDKFREVIDGSREQAIRASEIIRHLRQLVKKQASEKSEVDLNELIQGVVGFLEGEIQKRNIDLQLHLHENLPRLVVDNIQIEQVLINLLRNALEVERPVSSTTHEITIRTAIIDDKIVQVAISDNGAGMTSEILNQIFNPFFSTKGKRGMGMGLSICRSIVESHDGRLWATSEPGQGSTFFFNLPVSSRQLKSE
jgi:PAS domain S-box-containing protein